MPVIVVWSALHDARTCKICAAIDGYTWTFPDEQPMPNQLIHPIYGVVWNGEEGSNAHGKHGGNCRCHLEINVDWSTVAAKLRLLRDTLKQIVNSEMPEATHT